MGGYITDGEIKEEGFFLSSKSKDGHIKKFCVPVTKRNNIIPITARRK